MESAKKITSDVIKFLSGRSLGATNIATTTTTSAVSTATDTTTLTVATAKNS
ncbi:hypothetical protein Syun_017501 [Stephania yunnanensis]|uniref:Uncharacterized protein n=1 Tax=Stephania yunnanensis TaxID=152371 RepID=A0AAP0J765_9MAGN